MTVDAIDGLRLLLLAGGNAIHKAGSIIKNWASKVLPRIKSALNRAGQGLKRLSYWIKRTFFVVESAMPTIYKFNVKQLTSHPHWHVLTYNGPGSPITKSNRSWVRSTYGYLRATALPWLNSLDEFPFASTRQGGPRGPAQAMMVPTIENSVQGGLLGAFYRLSALRGKPGQFLVVPIPL